jgi:hypothetical protein
MAKKNRFRFGFFTLVILGSSAIIVIISIFSDFLTKTLGNAGFITIIVVLIILATAFPLIYFFRMLGSSYNLFLGGGKKSQSVRLYGRSATATVLNIGENSGGGIVTINDQPYLNLKLKIDDGYGQPYEVSFDTIIPRAAVPQFQPGATFPVKIDPNDPNTVVFDTLKEQ